MNQVDCIHCGNHFETKALMHELVRCPKCHKANQVPENKANLLAQKQYIKEMRERGLPIQTSGTHKKQQAPNTGQGRAAADELSKISAQLEKINKNASQYTDGDDWSLAVLLMMPIICAVGHIAVLLSVPLLFVQVSAWGLVFITISATAIAVTAREKQPLVGLSFMILWIFTYPAYVWGELPKYKLFALISTIIMVLAMIYVNVTVEDKLSEIASGLRPFKK